MHNKHCLSAPPSNIQPEATSNNKNQCAYILHQELHTRGAFISHTASRTRWCTPRCTRVSSISLSLSMHRILFLLLLLLLVFGFNYAHSECLYSFALLHWRKYTHVRMCTLLALVYRESARAHACSHSIAGLRAERRRTKRSGVYNIACILYYSVYERICERNRCGIDENGNAKHESRVLLICTI